ncbi:diaminopimelate decarboxylase [bacterium]|nr:diaminopimelate decarboxylase [bacterium]
MKPLQMALKRGMLSQRDTAVIFHDLDVMHARLDRIRNAFPEAHLHAVAIKANPVVGVLRSLVEAGAGLEAASWEEVSLALAAGCPPERIVFDSPAKTDWELEQALQLGVRLNADNLDELERLDRLQPTYPLGVRINPQVGAGSIAMTSVATRGGKFGMGLEETDLRALFARFPWLGGLHVHVGSQGCPMSQLVEGVLRVYRAGLKVGVRFFDMGGGLGVNYRDTAASPAPEEYARALRQACPEWAQVPLVSEFGRWIQGPSGQVAARVEYVKEGRLAVLHVGADMLLRLAYAPQDWYNRMEVLDSTGQPKSGPLSSWTLAGPLCFGGDIIGRGVELPDIRPGDWVVVHDVGAYTLGMWSRHCSRALPLVLGWRAGNLFVLKARESLEDVVRFWS